MRLTVSGDDLEFRPGETVLHVLTRHGIELPAVCRAGLCHACLLRVVHGDPGPSGRAALDDALQADGYFLACMARPATDLTVALAGADAFAPAEVLSVRPAGGGVLRVRVRTQRPLNFHAGQHVALRTPAGIVRVYSIASLPGEARDEGIEFHVRLYPGGAMSGWLASAARGDAIGLGRPGGSCHYRPDDPDCPLLLAGTGTGLAPLAAIARDAVAHGHGGPIIAIQGGASPDSGGNSPDARGASLDGRGDGPRTAGPAWPAPIRPRTCLLSRGEDIVTAVVAELVALPRPADAQAYLCGAPQVVAQLRRALFMAGLSLRRIHCDEFAPATTAPATTAGAATASGE